MITARVRKLVVALGLVAGLVVATASSASAHVTVSSPDAAPGGFGKLVFRVPSESETASTTAITVRLPSDTPFRFVSAEAVPGWTSELVTEELPEPVESDGFTLTEAVATVTWTADDGNGLQPGEFAEFALSVGRFPSDVDRLVLPATQTYSDGEVVEWADPPVEGEEAEHPAPVLELGDSPVTATEGADGSDTLARVLGAGGLVLGVIALVWVALTRRPRQPDTTS